MNNNTALFPGSFDPFTVGHESVVRRAVPIFDKIIIGIGYNTTKKGFFEPESRAKMIRNTFADEPKVIVELFTGLTIDYCKKINTQYILRGLRTAADFEYERAIGQMNNLMSADIETVFLLTKSEHSAISSTIVREILIHGGDVSRFVPSAANLNRYIPEQFKKA